LALNFFAGRTLNGDIARHPIFPWVLDLSRVKEEGKKQSKKKRSSARIKQRKKWRYVIDKEINLTRRRKSFDSSVSFTVVSKSSLASPPRPSSPPSFSLSSSSSSTPSPSPSPILTDVTTSCSVSDGNSGGVGGGGSNSVGGGGGAGGGGIGIIRSIPEKRKTSTWNWRYFYMSRFFFFFFIHCFIDILLLLCDMHRWRTARGDDQLDSAFFSMCNLRGNLYGVRSGKTTKSKSERKGWSEEKYKRPSPPSVVDSPTLAQQVEKAGDEGMNYSLPETGAGSTTPSSLPHHVPDQLSDHTYLTYTGL
jgi:uncharacterized membrane protein YgcG